MAKARDLAALAGLAGLAYAMRNKGSKDDAGDQKTSSYTGDTKKVAASDDRMSNEDYIKSRMKKAPEAEDANSGSEGRRTSMGVETVTKAVPKAAPAKQATADRRSLESGMSRGTRAADPRNLETGMSRGTRTTSVAGAGRGVVNPPRAASADPRSAEAGMSRGTRTTSMAGAGRGLVNPPGAGPTDPRSSESGMSRGTRTSAPPFKGGQAGYDEAGNFMGGQRGFDEAGNPMKKGGMTKMASGGMTASRRADGIATKGKTRGKIC
jgi:hypothetical protein